MKAGELRWQGAYSSFPHSISLEKKLETKAKFSSLPCCCALYTERIKKCSEDELYFPLNIQGRNRKKLPLYSTLCCCNLLATCENLQGLSQMPYRKTHAGNRGPGSLSGFQLADVWWALYLMNTGSHTARISLSLPPFFFLMNKCCCSSTIYHSLPLLFMYLFLRFSLPHTPLLCPKTLLRRRLFNEAPSLAPSCGKRTV